MINGTRWLYRSSKISIHDLNKSTDDALGHGNNPSEGKLHRKKSIEEMFVPKRCLKYAIDQKPSKTENNNRDRSPRANRRLSIKDKPGLHRDYLNYRGRSWCRGSGKLDEYKG